MTAEAMAPPRTKSQALRSFDVADFPALNGREEEWRFTPLKRLRGLAVRDPDTPIPGVAPKVEYGDLPAGVTVSTVDRSDPRVGSVLTPFDRISALASARPRARRCWCRSTGPPCSTAGPSSGWSATAPTLAFGHTFVEVGELAEATLVLEQTGSVTLADNVEVAVGDGARLTLVTVTDWAADAVQAQHVKFRLGRDARLTHVQVSLGGDLVRQYTSVEYAGRGGDAEAYGLYFADAGQHFEHRLLVDHCGARLPQLRRLPGRAAGRRRAHRLGRRRADPGRGHRHRHLRDQPEPGPDRRGAGRLGTQPGDRDRRGGRGRARQRHRALRRRAAVLPDVPRHSRTRSPASWSSAASSPSCSTRSRSRRCASGWATRSSPGWLEAGSDS